MRVHLIDDTESRTPRYYISTVKPREDDSQNVVQEFEVQVVKGDAKLLEKLLNWTGSFADLPVKEYKNEGR